MKQKVLFEVWDKEKRVWIPDQPGIFHTWGVCYEEMATGVGNYTTAIIEDTSGQMHEIPPSRIKFV